MIVCNALFFISKIIFWKAQNFTGFLLERVILAVVISGLSGVDSSILYLSSGESDSHRVFGIYQSLGTAGLLFSAAVCTLFVGENYRTAGVLTVISYGIAAVLSFGLTEVRITANRQKTSLRYSLGVLKETFANRRLLLLIIAVALISEVHQTITVFFNQLQYMKAGMSARLISAVYIMITLSGLAGVLSAPLTKRLKAKFFGGMLFAVCGSSCLILAITNDAFVSVFGVLAVSISFSLISPLGTELQSKAITTSDRATALSMNTLVMDLVAVFTNLVFGKFADFDLSAAMCFGAMLCMLGMLLYLRSLKSLGFSKS